MNQFYPNAVRSIAMDQARGSGGLGVGAARDPSSRADINLEHVDVRAAHVSASPRVNVQQLREQRETARRRARGIHSVSLAAAGMQISSGVC